MKKIFFAFLFFISCVNVQAQKEISNWYFGDSAAVSFVDTGIVTIDDSPLRSCEASSSISDSNGNLLFYTNGIDVWNKVNEQMSNGFGLLGGPEVSGVGSSTTNGVMILPFPNSNNLYCILTVYGFGSNAPGLAGLHYSVVDITADSGFGDVTQKNIALYDTALSEKMCVVKHGNGRDWWILLHTSDSTKKFVKFLLDPSGFHGPFFQFIGDKNFIFNGEMISSEQGDKIAFVTSDYILNLFSFNRCNGQLSNFIDLNPTAPCNGCYTGFYGLSFSPNGKFLYTSDINRLYQYELDSLPAIVRHQIYYTASTSKTYGQHQLGPDGKIYICFGTTGYGSQSEHYGYNQFLISIDSPDVVDSGCHYHPLSVSLGDHNNIWGLPNFPNLKLGVLEDSNCDTISNFISSIEEETNFIISPNPATTEIKITNLSPTENQVSLFNLLGQQVKSIRVSNVQSTILPVSDLPAGIYVVTIFDGEKIVCKKLVKE